MSSRRCTEKVQFTSVHRIEDIGIPRYYDSGETKFKQNATLIQGDEDTANFDEAKVDLQKHNIDESPTVLGTVETDINMKQN